MNKYSVKLECWSDEEKYYVVCNDVLSAVGNFMQELRLPYLPGKMIVNLEEMDVEVKKECHVLINYTAFLEVLEALCLPVDIVDSIIGSMEDNDVFIRWFDV